MAVIPKMRRGGGKGGHWERLLGRMAWAQIAHASVDARIVELQHNPGVVRTLAERAAPFLPHLLEEVERQRLPPDLVVVPMVESGYEATAVSPKEAAGIWQIIPGTAQQYGLRLEEGYDGRFDIHASTKAALTYFKHLENLFQGDWLLALAAYNAGEGAVQRAMEANRKANRGTTFWELDLPAETKAYVPRILALSRIFTQPALFGFDLGHAATAPRLVRIETPPGVHLAELIARSGLPAGEFYRLNAGFRPGVQPPAQTYRVFLPAMNAETLAMNLEGVKLLDTRRVVVKKGDTLALLAKRHGVTTLKLAQWNGLKPDSPLKAGQELIVLAV